MELVTDNHPLLFFANGNRREKEEEEAVLPQITQKKEEKMKEDEDTLNSPPVAKWLKEEQEYLVREIHFYEMVQHVIEKIEKENREEYMEEEKSLWPALSMLDMKKYLKMDVNTSGVSEHSSVFILESVSTKIGRLLHSVDLYDLCDLAACTPAQVERMVKKAKNVTKGELEYAVQDAKTVMDILKTEKRSKANWGNNLSRMTDALHLKEGTEKLANFVWNINPKGLVDVIVRSQDKGEDDIDSFYSM